jgi:hypothetical protein
MMKRFTLLRYPPVRKFKPLYRTNVSSNNDSPASYIRIFLGARQPESFRSRPGGPKSLLGSVTVLTVKGVGVSLQRGSPCPAQ